MSDASKITAEEVLKIVMERCPEFAEQLATALNNAPDGQWISGSEEAVRDAGQEFVRAAFEAALQRKVGAADAAFPPPQTANGKRYRNKGL